MAAWSSESGSTPSGPMTLRSSSWVTREMVRRWTGDETRKDIERLTCLKA